MARYALVIKRPPDSAEFTIFATNQEAEELYKRLETRYTDHPEERPAFLGLISYTLLEARGSMIDY